MDSSWPNVQDDNETYYVKDKHLYSVKTNTGIIEIYDLTLTDADDGKEIVSKTRCLASRVSTLPKPEILHLVWSINFCEMNKNLVILFSNFLGEERRLWSQVLLDSNSNTPGNPYNSVVSNRSLHAAPSELTGNIFVFYQVADGGGPFIEFIELTSNGHNIVRTVREPWNRVIHPLFSNLSFLLCGYHGDAMMKLALDCEEETITLESVQFPTTSTNSYIACIATDHDRCLLVLFQCITFYRLAIARVVQDVTTYRYLAQFPIDDDRFRLDNMYVDRRGLIFLSWVRKNRYSVFNEYYRIRKKTE